MARAGRRRASRSPWRSTPDARRGAPFPEGEAEATRRLEAFLEHVDVYGTDHDRLDVEGTSSLSADLKFGTLSPRAVVDAAGEGSAGRTAFVRQIACPRLVRPSPGGDPPHVATTTAMRERYDDLEWRNDPTAWKGGFTGYPVIDAGMRQLRQTGWMHNRARLLCGSFLVKNLLVDWRIGERHFRHLLVDGDVPQNVGNWQWVAGTGPDAASTTASSTRSHRVGSSIRRVPTSGVGYPSWRPSTPTRSTRRGTAAPTDCSRPAPGDYPPPIVDLGDSRRRALAAYAASTPAPAEPAEPSAS